MAWLSCERRETGADRTISIDLAIPAAVLNDALPLDDDLAFFVPGVRVVVVSRNSHPQQLLLSGILPKDPPLRNLGSSLIPPADALAATPAHAVLNGVLAGLEDAVLARAEGDVDGRIEQAVQKRVADQRGGQRLAALPTVEDVNSRRTTPDRAGR